MVKRKISIQDNDTSESAMEIAGMKVFKSIRTIRIEIFEILPKTSHVEKPQTEIKIERLETSTRGQR